jgi:hypothetical protein
LAYTVHQCTHHHHGVSPSRYTASHDEGRKVRIIDYLGIR